MINTNLVGIILFQKTIEKEILKITNEILKKINIRNGFLSYTTGEIKNGWKAKIINYKLFKNFRDFDNFLLFFADKTKDNPNILVLGHLDKSGYLWNDYNNFSHTKKLQEDKKDGESKFEGDN